MEIDLEKIQELYGSNTIKEIHDNMDQLLLNAEYLKKRGFEVISEIIEMYPYAFLEDENIFQEKINKLIEILGVEYIEKLQEDFSLWSILDE